jgi:transcription initiation factor TFIIIB Brf1 subunit/transcription initiation factor TFIIB
MNRSYPQSNKKICKKILIKESKDDSEDILDDAFKFAFNNCNIDNEKENNEVCDHSCTVEENGQIFCMECGIKLGEEVSNEAEWRYYGNRDNISNSDPSRVQYRKINDRNIIKELKDFGLPNDVIEISNNLYTKVTKNKIRRSNLRKGIIYACVFHAYKLLGNPQTPETIQQMFKIPHTRIITKGVHYFYLKMPKEDIQNIDDITAEHFIPTLLNKFNVKEEHINNVLELYKKISDKGSLINTSNPQSISSGFVFYYLKKLNLDISASNFGKITGLSEITINRIVKQIDDIINQLDIIV